MKLPTFNRSKNYYNLLQVAYSATATEIKTAYRNLAKISHPDKAKQTEKQDFIAIKEAYDVLSNPVLKTQYDAFLRKYGSAPRATVVIKPIHSAVRKRNVSHQNDSVFQRFIQQPLGQFFTLHFPK